MSFEFTEENLRQVKEIVSRYPNTEAALLPVLHLAQDQVQAQGPEGYVSPDVLDHVAHVLDLPPVKVRQVATFYTMYNKAPVGRYHVQVCTNVACHLTGGVEIFEHFKKTLGVGNHGTTDDGLFTLEEVECLAACGTAPALQINDRYDLDNTIRYYEQTADNYEHVGNGQRRTSIAELIKWSDQIIDELRKKPEGRRS
ncbi:MAG: NADH-quinone oxidoreductase subunit NuoE [Bradymonadia bacterium]